ncbi:hypothetical protein QC761_610270 [Podospora bellae-mahoneyi]|uniref:Ricin B lectin domain-containing protein n=1 Tax=Podospora bellae-mahoneyi TaxID=2093777 RepID=A0ABR0FB47_9PEZI|nr:hypothetical protein QC761_610270 [Podospora bellae-mahoneyi]
MFSTSFLVLALVATGLGQVVVPEGYRKVYITSAVDAKFVIVPKAPLPAKAGTGVVVQIRNDKPEQQWYLKDGTGVRIQLAETNLCLDAGAKSNWRDMGSLTLKECSATEPAQKWNVMADGRIALEDSPQPQQCVDLVYMRATPNNAVGLYTCAGLGNTGAKDKGINWPLVNATAP